MQVMPFWIPKIGNSEHNLFHLRTNLRYGCVIFSHYLSVNNGDIFQALELYNSNPNIKDYPTAVYKAWRMHWTYGINPNIPS
jgi:soluble lytic murein transglycosylase-like protein